MSRLPTDIIEENILTRLPVKSIARFRCVSRNWYLLFRNPNFIRNHLNHAILINKFNIMVNKYGDIDDVPSTEANLYSVINDVLSSTSSGFLGHALKIDYPFMSAEHVPELLGSSNGLVCIEPISGNICIWNPATREYKKVPKPSANSNDFFIAHGFYFDCKNDDYKVLSIVDFEDDEFYEARFYSLASDSWKNLGFIPYDFSLSLTNGLLHNGVLHWIVATRLKSRVIVCFDVSDETFHHVPLPIEDEEPFIVYLGILEGKLCLFRTNHMDDPDICTNQNGHVDVWIMMDNKWSKHLIITATGLSYRRPVQTLQNGEILLDGGPIEEEGSGLISYDPNLGKARALKIHGFPGVFDVETLVALNSGTYVGQ